jgi:hypothetical protein
MNDQNQTLESMQMEENLLSLSQENSIEQEDYVDEEIENVV